MNFTPRIIMLLALVLLLGQKFVIGGRLLLLETSKTSAVKDSETFDYEGKRVPLQQEVNFLEYLAEQNKTYNSYLEFNQREQIFTLNQIWINEQNAAARHSNVPNAAKYENNQFSDMTVSEKEQLFGDSLSLEQMIKIMKKRSRKNKPEESHSDQYAIDWRGTGMVNPVRNRGRCGSSWAFSSISQIETLYAIKHGKIYNLSVQQILDCTKGHLGCQTGIPNNVFDYAKDNYLTEESIYRFEPNKRENICKAEQYDKTQVKVTSYSSYNDWTADDFKAALQNGPVGILVAAQNKHMFSYRSGILDIDDCPDKLDSTMLMVGWGKVSHTEREYWIIRNSYGSDWGEKGYMKVAIRPSGPGVCQVQSWAFIAEVN